MADSFAGTDVARLAFDGTDTSTTITDALGHTFTCNGTAMLKTTTPVFGTASLYIDGTSGACVTSPNSSDWDFGAGDFCIDFFFKPVALGAKQMMAVGDGTTYAWTLTLGANGLLQFVSAVDNDGDGEYDDSDGTNDAVMTKVVMSIESKEEYDTINIFNVTILVGVRTKITFCVW